MRAADHPHFVMKKLAALSLAAATALAAAQTFPKSVQKLLRSTRLIQAR